MICLMEIWVAFFKEVVTNCSTICLTVLPSIHPVNLRAIVRPESVRMLRCNINFFLAKGLFESCMIKAGANKTGLDLSEQYLVDCGYDGK